MKDGALQLQHFPPCSSNSSCLIFFFTCCNVTVVLKSPATSSNWCLHTRDWSRWALFMLSWQEHLEPLQVNSVSVPCSQVPVPRAIFKADWLYSPVMEPAPSLQHQSECVHSWPVKNQQNTPSTTPQSSPSSTVGRVIFDAALLSLPQRRIAAVSTQSTWLCYFWRAEAEASSLGSSSVSMAIVRQLDGWMCSHF